VHHRLEVRRNVARDHRDAAVPGLERAGRNIRCRRRASMNTERRQLIGYVGRF
jgi:hypothetical protein